MKPADWKIAAEIIGIAAIVGSLIFVGMEMRQTRELAMAAAFQSRADTELALEIAFLEHEGLSRVFDRIETGEPLSDADVRLLKRMMRMRFIDYENVHYQWLNGLLTDEIWQVYRDGIEGYLDNPMGPAWWKESRLGWRESFRDEVDDIVAGIESRRAE